MPTFRGPFLSQRASTVSSPRDNNSSASSSTSSNISGREQRLQVLDEQRLQVLDATIAPAHLRQQHPGHISSISPSTADLTASNVEFWHNQSPDLQQPRTAQEQQSLSSQQPDLQQHRQTIHCGQLSLPSRLQGVWGGDTLEPRGGARTFTSPLARGFTLRDGDPCPFDDAHQAGASFDKKFEDLVQQQQQQKQKQQLKVRCIAAAVFEAAALAGFPNKQSYRRPDVVQLLVNVLETYKSAVPQATVAGVVRDPGQEQWKT